MLNKAQLLNGIRLDLLRFLYLKFSEMLSFAYYAHQILKTITFSISAIIKLTLVNPIICIITDLATRQLLLLAQGGQNTFPISVVRSIKIILPCTTYSCSFELL